MTTFASFKRSIVNGTQITVDGRPVTVSSRFPGSFAYEMDGRRIVVEFPPARMASLRNDGECASWRIGHTHTFVTFTVTTATSALPTQPTERN